MKRVQVKDVATSLTATIFLVIGISGIMMFFHFNDGMVKQLHEILGLVFVGAALFHIIMNWKSMKNYFSKKIFIVSTVLVTIISVGFITQSLNKTENPKKVLMQKVLNAPITDSFKLLNGNYEQALKKLENNGIKILDNNSISSIAKANNTSPFNIVSIMTVE